MPADDADLQAGLDALMDRIDVASKAIVVKSVAAIQATGMSKTKVISGTLRRSWHSEAIDAAEGVYAAKTGPTTVYARRIELGFYNMRDKLGRLYHQRGKPYVKPALVQTAAPIQAYVKTEMTAAIRG